jgi:hypothetical protein
MRASAKDGACLAALIRLAIPVCQQAERECPRKGPGRKPEIPDWATAAFIVVAIAKQRKSMSSQYRFLKAHRRQLEEALSVERLPARSTYFDRYRRAWKLYETAIRIAGEKAVQKRFASARCVAVDKSVIRARGPLWNKRHVARGRVPKGADLDATWTYSRYGGWQLGYSYEVVVTAEKAGPVWPLVASAGPASPQPNRTFPSKVPQLHRQTRYILGDSGYDSNDLSDAVELNDVGCRTGRRLLCPQYRRGKGCPPAKTHKENHRRRQRRLLREQRWKFFQCPFAQRLMRRRGVRVEPFNDWLKSRFDLHHHAWHRGLDNNRTQLLGAILTYQLLMHLNHQRGRRDGCIQWILDAL